MALINTLYATQSKILSVEAAHNGEFPGTDDSANSSQCDPVVGNDPG